MGTFSASRTHQRFGVMSSLLSNLRAQKSLICALNKFGQLYCVIGYSSRTIDSCIIVISARVHVFHLSQEDLAVVVVHLMVVFFCAPHQSLGGECGLSIDPNSPGRNLRPCGK
ncbi:uncharacterized protein PHALS_14732 [Plasmopara halstedii]|uniref:Uncharacterized protein n=1 Tax=Plasmopara halstedii TaxID=4781 RepID=A0A0P1A420_PLAHL|nr:uncharacterized protein PHALS_14732 [Plasmopara halstedii]CEG35166.1 hypothetical protein PHALS_14732 [Plasmopara halstedii]|eukprot:XP_024571535.1 hypothetical protein PHALS_14732 [Plasmopara halstedii]